MEEKIWDNWGFTIHSSPNAPKYSPFSQSSSTWLPLPQSFTKLNFDGASKGNPNPTGMGGVIQDHSVTILHIYAQHLGHDTNNSVELVALLEGLRIVVRNGYNMIIIKGVSTIIINSFQHIINGTPPEKTTRS